MKFLNVIFVFVLLCVSFAVNAQDQLKLEFKVSVDANKLGDDANSNAVKMVLSSPEFKNYNAKVFGALELSKTEVGKYASDDFLVVRIPSQREGINLAGYVKKEKVFVLVTSFIKTGEEQFEYRIKETQNTVLGGYDILNGKIVKDIPSENQSRKDFNKCTKELKDQIEGNWFSWGVCQFMFGCAGQMGVICGIRYIFE